MNREQYNLRNILERIDANQSGLISFEQVKQVSWDK
jgi:Ca2+-binding EF-hand superfamily protein